MFSGIFKTLSFGTEISYNNMPHYTVWYTFKNRMQNLIKIYLKLNK